MKFLPSRKRVVGQPRSQGPLSIRTRGTRLVVGLIYTKQFMSWACRELVADDKLVPCKSVLKARIHGATLRGIVRATFLRNMATRLKHFVRHYAQYLMSGYQALM